MKKVIITLFIFVVLLLPASVLAKDTLDKDTLKSLPAGETHEGDYFAAGDMVEIYGKVSGDLYAAGGQVIIDGEIEGDVLAAGGMVTISGKVGQDARVAGGNITITGEIGKNLTIVGGNIQIANSANVTGNLVGGVGNLHIDAPIGGNVSIGVGNLTLSNTVGGNIEAGVGSMRITSNASIGGDLTYWTDEDEETEISIDEAASISGAVNKKSMPINLDTDKLQKAPKGFFKGFNLFTKAISFMATLVIGFLLIRFFPKCSANAANTLSTKLWKSLGIGFLALIVTPILIVLLAITIFGIPLAIMLAFLFFVYLYIARIYAMLAIGNKTVELARKKTKIGWAFLLGAIIYYLLSLIPFIGGLIKLAIIIVAFGAALISGHSTYLTARKKEVF